MSQCQKVMLEGHETVNLVMLEELFYKCGYVPESIRDFYPRLAIGAFFQKFTELANQTRYLGIISNRRIYCQQLVKYCENLNLKGVPGTFDRNPMKLEDVFVNLQASQNIPESDILVEDEKDEEQPDRIPRVIKRPTIETTRILSVSEALKEKANNDF